MALSKEELEELKKLEDEVDAERSADEEAEKRQHLDALRMRKKFATKHGKHGRDFAVLETDVGVNIAIRQPTEMESEMVAERNDAEAHEAFAKAITVSPTGDELTQLIVKYPGIRTAIIKSGFDLLGGLRDEKAKK